MDQALSLRAEERRGLFEDAAGIRQFQAQRTDAEQKLTLTQNNLARLHDIVGEIEPRLGPLAEQARRAHEYTGTHEELFHSSATTLVSQPVAASYKPRAWARRAGRAHLRRAHCPGTRGSWPNRMARFRNCGRNARRLLAAHRCTCDASAANDPRMPCRRPNAITRCCARAAGQPRPATDRHSRANKNSRPRPSPRWLTHTSPRSKTQIADSEEQTPHHRAGDGNTGAGSAHAARQEQGA